MGPDFSLYQIAYISKYYSASWLSWLLDKIDINGSIIRSYLEMQLHSAHLRWWKPSYPLAVSGGRICTRSMHNHKYTTLHTVRIFSE